jgi:ABC-type bacteriocin/lantibiotic exporter with double-glycine peptidase domain
MVLIKNYKYHEMSFREIDEIRNDIKNGKLILLIKITELMLYLNQINKFHGFVLKRMQEFQLLAFLSGIILIFINWKLALIILVFSLPYSIFLSKLAFYLIRKNCLENRVFLKFALATELAKVIKHGEKNTDPIYKKKY